MKNKLIKPEGFLWFVARNIVLLAGLVLICGPLYLVLVNSFKSLEESGRNFFSLPSRFNLDNFKQLFATQNYLGYVKNSTLITVLSILIEITLVPSVSFAIVRNFTKPYYKFVYFFLLMGLFIPSQVVILPVTKFMTGIKLLNQFGLIVLYATFSLTRGVFLFVNYIRTLPYELEEAARVDGCNVFKTYINIVLPMTGPMLATLIVMDALWYWNDFLLPLMILNRSRGFWTLPLFQYNFKTEYSFNYTMSFTAYLISMLPILVVYIFAQKNIIKGLTAGALKG
ncbi:MAG: carbohydrate ABC transporter permease [Treponema sp.]|jgi:raffinose/stachyose/melibiose transport system permease protein|nr:carbohydrate ABC transporter permease [Treponema sp.]